MIIILSASLHLKSEESSHQKSTQCMFLNIAARFWFIQNCRVIHKTKKHLSKQVLAVFQATAQCVCR